MEYDDVVPMLPAKSMTHSKSFLDRLQRVEKHLRKNKLKLTLTQRLGNAADEDEVFHKSSNQAIFFVLLYSDMACVVRKGGDQATAQSRAKIAS